VCHDGSDFGPTVAAQEDIGFGTFNINFEEIDGATVVAFAQLCQRGYRRSNGPMPDTECLSFLRNVFARRREPVQAINHVEINFAALASDQAANHYIAPTQPLIKRG